jgi:hypothetical protein
MLDMTIMKEYVAPYMRMPVTLVSGGVLRCLNERDWSVVCSLRKADEDGSATV